MHAPERCSRLLKRGQVYRVTSVLDGHAPIRMHWMAVWTPFSVVLEGFSANDTVMAFAPPHFDRVLTA